MFSKRKITVISIDDFAGAVRGGLQEEGPPPPPPPPPPRAAGARAAQTCSSGSDRVAVHRRADFDSARPIVHLALGSFGRCHQRLHRSGHRHRAGYRQPAGLPQRFHHLYPDRHRTGRKHHRLGHGHREAPPPPPPPPPPPAPWLRWSSAWDPTCRMLYFDYDKSDIRCDARDALTQDAAALKSIFGRISRMRPSWWKAIATSADRPSTTSDWATGAPVRPRSFWCNWACPPTG